MDVFIMLTSVALSSRQKQLTERIQESTHLQVRLKLILEMKEQLFFEEIYYYFFTYINPYQCENTTF